MSVYIPDMEMPKDECVGIFVYPDGRVHVWRSMSLVGQEYMAVPVSEHGRLIDADALRAKMYHETFETDTPMQKWDSGCWIRYKMFERMEESAPTIIPASTADKEGEG